MVDVRYVSRDDASLRAHRALTAIRKPVDTIFIHHMANKVTDNPLKDWSNAQGFHMNTRKWADIAYTWGVGIDRRNGAEQPVVMEGRQVQGFAAVGAHTKDWNARSIAIAVNGNFENDEASDLLILGVKYAIRLAKERNQVIGNPVIRSHSDVVRTACAGRNLRVRLPELYADNPNLNVPVLPAPAPPVQSRYPGFPLPKGHWFGLPAKNARNHSGFWVEDRPRVALLQSEFERRGWRITVSGRFDQRTHDVVLAFQREKGLKADGLVGVITHRQVWEAPVT